MSSLSIVESKLPSGFRFHPRDEELICDYLMKWVSGCPNQCPLLIEVDLNKCEPWDIPDTACVGSKEWYFYSRKDKKYATGLRTNRATISGYWKATGKDRPITRNGALVGMRKTLVFYQGRAPKGSKTEWVMHEFRLEGTLWPRPKMVPKGDWVLCRVFYKNRSDVHQTKQEPDELGALTEPYVSFDPIHEASISNQYDEQVPCFSIFTQNQTTPTFSLLSHVEPPESMPPSTISKNIPNFGAVFPADLGIYGSQSINSRNSDKKVLRAVLDHLAKIENCNNNNINSNNYNYNYNPGGMIKEGTYSSPSFGEGSPDSYLSEVGLSSIWNQYS